ncbi:hypothetical protein [Streptomyces peucetius]|jgi:hypothetical protein|uniref:Uncharacterized protein n=1 Tax=Streptomyces peucetius TaxID=1950 RepID=A0ABY6I769_STRPE|nr:hypothetical protein [Streptomyces peucetius]UYQ62691.1 hypothetical protein OGH68_15180 [Streptomyces peucetius]
MRNSTRHALERAAELTRKGRLVEAVATAEVVINAADEFESADIRQWLTDHADDFTRED